MAFDSKKAKKIRSLQEKAGRSPATRHGANSGVLTGVARGSYPDKRTVLGRELAALRKALVRDLGGDLSAQESLLVDRIVSKSFRCRCLEAAMFQGDPAADAQYIALSNSLRLDLQALGLRRRAKDVTSLKDYLKDKGHDDN